MKSIFLSHASEDKDDFVRPLAEALKQHGMFNVWYDEYSLKWGDSLLRSISTGLSSCDYAIVVFSHNFFSKAWPQSELDGLFSLESIKGKIILPIWKDITKEEVAKYSPILSDRLAVSSSVGIKKIISELEMVIDTSDRAIRAKESLHLSHFSDALARKKESEESIRKTKTRQGTDSAREAATTLIREFENQIDSVLPNVMQHDYAKQPSYKSDTNCSVNYHLLSDTLIIGAHYKNNIMNTCNEAILRIYLSEISHKGFNSDYYPITENTYTPYIDKNDSILWSSIDNEEKPPMTYKQVIEQSITDIATSLQPYL